MTEQQASDEDLAFANGTPASRIASERVLNGAGIALNVTGGAMLIGGVVTWSVWSDDQRCQLCFAREPDADRLPWQNSASRAHPHKPSRYGSRYDGNWVFGTDEGIGLRQSYRFLEADPVSRDSSDAVGLRCFP